MPLGNVNKDELKICDTPLQLSDRKQHSIALQNVKCVATLKQPVISLPWQQ